MISKEDIQGGDRDSISALEVSRGEIRCERDETGYLVRGGWPAL